MNNKKKQKLLKKCLCLYQQDMQDKKKNFNTTDAQSGSSQALTQQLNTDKNISNVAAVDILMLFPPSVPSLEIHLREESCPWT